MIQRLQTKRNEEGFTLIELLIVIIVLGILAAIVVFAVGSTRKDSVASACKTNVKSVELSAEAVNTKLGSYPAGYVQPVPAAGNPATTNLANSLNATDLVSNGTNGALLKAWPTSSDYFLQYQYLPGSSSYQINVFKGSGTAEVAQTGVVAVAPVASPAVPATSVGVGNTGCGAL
jgi:general secretion pathway protein G